MNDLFNRQAVVMHRLIADYRSAKLDLHTLIQRLEGITEVINLDVWREAVFPIVLEMEQVNVVAVDKQKHLSEANKILIESSMYELEMLIERFEKMV